MSRILKLTDGKAERKEVEQLADLIENRAPEALERRLEENPELIKQFALGERTNLQFLTQFINVTNTAILGRPSFFQGSTFGVISSSNPGRQVQFGLKLLF